MKYFFINFLEPEYKAIFELSFTHDDSVGVFSNTMETITPKLV
jgi:hypothetical protein